LILTALVSLIPRKFLSRNCFSMSRTKWPLQGMPEA
jgi:hypothetical protein